MSESSYECEGKPHSQDQVPGASSLQSAPKLFIFRVGERNGEIRARCQMVVEPLGKPVQTRVRWNIEVGNNNVSRGFRN